MMSENERARLAADMRWSIEQAEFILRLLALREGLYLSTAQDRGNTDNLFGEVKRFKNRLQAAENDITLAVVAYREDAALREFLVNPGPGR